MSADRCNELIELHEKIVLQSGSELSENKNLPAHPDRRQGPGLHQPAQQLRHVRHRQSPSARSCTRRCSSSTRAASSTRSSGWHRSARCTSSSTPTSSRIVLDPKCARCRSNWTHPRRHKERKKKEAASASVSGPPPLPPPPLPPPPSRVQPPSSPPPVPPPSLVLRLFAQHFKAVSIP